MVYYSLQRVITPHTTLVFLRFFTFHIARDVSDSNLADIFRANSRKPFKPPGQPVIWVRRTFQNAFLNCKETVEFAGHTDIILVFTLWAMLLKMHNNSAPNFAETVQSLIKCI